MVLQRFIQQLSISSGAPIDILKMGFCLAASILLSPLYRIINGRLTRNILSITIGILFLGFILEELALFILASIIIPYILITTLPKPFLMSVILSFLILLFAHCYRFIFESAVWKVDCSVYVMLLVTKLTYFGKWYQKQSRSGQSIFLDYLAYNLFYPCILAGPTFSFSTYIEFAKEQPSKNKKSLNLIKALQPVAFFLPIAVVTIYFMPTFTQDWVITSQFFLNLALWQKILILLPVGFLYRAKYYAAWYIGQTAANLSGLSEDKEGGFERVKAVNIKFEYEPNAKMKTQYWNTSMQQWLKIVVYDELSQQFSQQIAFFGTFIISAFWHGLYFTYYVGFIMWGILLHLAKWGFKWSQIFPKSLTDSTFYSIIVWFISSCYMNQIGMFMVVLNWGNAVKFYQSLYYFPVISLVILLGASFVLRAPSGKKNKANKKEN